jgi:hypothetical protein
VPGHASSTEVVFGPRMVVQGSARLNELHRSSCRATRSTEVVVGPSSVVHANARSSQELHRSSFLFEQSRARQCQVTRAPQKQYSARTKLCTAMQGHHTTSTEVVRGPRRVVHGSARSHDLPGHTSHGNSGPKCSTAGHCVAWSHPLYGATTGSFVYPYLSIHNFVCK